MRVWDGAAAAVVRPGWGRSSCSSDCTIMEWGGELQGQSGGNRNSSDETILECVGGRASSVILSEEGEQGWTIMGLEGSSLKS